MLKIDPPVPKPPRERASDLSTNIRPLKPADILRFIGDIHARYPTLRTDLTGLSNMPFRLVFGVIPSDHILLETLYEGEMSTKRLGEWFSYCDVPRPHIKGVKGVGVAETAVEEPVALAMAAHDPCDCLEQADAVPR